MPEHPSTKSQNRPEPETQGAGRYYLRNREVLVPAGYLAVGHVVGAHGLRGELKVTPYTDFPERFAPGASLRLGTNLEEVTIAAVREHKGNLLVLIEEIADRSEAEACRDLWLFVDEAAAGNLDEDSYWIHDIVGMAVFTEVGQELGRITDVMVTGANDVYLVHPAPGVNQGRELLLPAIADVVLQVDVPHKRMVVRIPDGLMETVSLE
jgi:16S rRNA processing protein RimM